MKRGASPWVVLAVCAAIIAASVMFSREAFLPDGASDADADPATAAEAASAVEAYLSDESFQGFATLTVDEAVRNVIRALADVVRGSSVNGVYPPREVRLRALRDAHEAAAAFERGVPTYDLMVAPGARERVSEVDYMEGVRDRGAEYAALMRRAMFDEYGTMAELADAACSDGPAAKEGVRWELERRCGRNF